jgi:adenylate cyclase
MKENLFKNKILVSILISLTCSILVIILWTFNVFESMELKSLDLRFLVRGAKPAREDIVIVALDDQTFSELKVYPVPRGYYAKLIRNLNEAGTKNIIFDITFSDYSQKPAQDSLFIQTVKEAGNVILCEKIAVGTQYGKFRHDSLEPLIPELKAAAHDTGFIDTSQDIDGFVRQYMVARKFLDRWYPSLGLTTVGAILGYPPDQEIEYEKGYFRYGDLKIPRYEGRRMLINYAGPRGSFPTISLEQVLDDVPDPGAIDGMSGYDILKQSGIFQDKTVMIGVTFSEAHDEFATPFFLSETRALMPGVEIHSNAVQTILNSDYISRIGFGTRLLILLLSSMFVGIIISRTKPIMGMLTVIIVIAILVIISFILFVNWDIWMDTTDAIGVVLLTATGNLFYQYLLARKERQAIKGMFSHYLAEAVVNELLTDPDKLNLGGEERYMSIFFSDIEGFTTISEHFHPTELAKLLNEYLTLLTDIILQHNGIIDKYEGDAVMAEFGAPISFEDHALRACLAALDCQKALEERRQKWMQEGKPPLKTRIGINTGNMVVGNMGSRDVFNYTVIGDSVNLGARLESANKEYGTYLMISEYTYEEAKDGIEARYLDKIQVKGKTEAVVVYELLCRKGELSEEMKELLKHYDRGIKCYINRDWENAVAYFENALEINRKDAPSMVYLRRSRAFNENPPDDGWDEITRLFTK